jgi:hypothetical protein
MDIAMFEPFVGVKEVRRRNEEDNGMRHELACEISWDDDVFCDLDRLQVFIAHAWNMNLAAGSSHK